MKAMFCAPAGCAAVAILVAMLAVALRPAAATQAFTQQTGLPCGKCHTDVATGKLTPFGEKFKANGYKVK